GAAIKRQSGPTALILSRQNLPHQQRSKQQLADIQRGGYVLKDCEGTPELILIATGSEISLAMSAAATLTEQGRAVRVVSMPATDVFDAQDAAYRKSVLPTDVTRRIAIEAGHRDFWYKYVGLEGRIIGMESFGESAPADDLFKHFGFTIKNLIATAEELLGSTKG
ncbi:MAG: transketolase-like TK C-terminal-containing protein, partial [Halomonas sp.]|uniref:transketolase-like TK C-terminal-containing protein n=1 Tax=Halomonas sp. TaxID=1486246 RepID=UPI003F924C88